MKEVQLGIDLWQAAAALSAFFVAGIVRVELLAYRVRELERQMLEKEKLIFAIQTEVNTVNDGLVRELSEIKEVLAWIKGRFSLLEQKDDAR